MDGELQHTGWVKINLGMQLEDVQNKSYWEYQYQSSTFPEICITLDSMIFRKCKKKVKSGQCNRSEGRSKY